MRAYIINDREDEDQIARNVREVQVKALCDRWNAIERSLQRASFDERGEELLAEVVEEARLEAREKAKAAGMNKDAIREAMDEAEEAALEEANLPFHRMEAEQVLIQQMMEALDASLEGIDEDEDDDY